LIGHSSGSAREKLDLTEMDEGKVSTKSSSSPITFGATLSQFLSLILISFVSMVSPP